MEFIWSREFQKRYQKLPKKVQQHLKERLNLFIRDPFDPMLNNHRLAGAYRLHRSINVTGDYRAVYREVGPGVVKWVSVGTHSQLYD